jgi:hypothetical protein
MLPAHLVGAAHQILDQDPVRLHVGPSTVGIIDHRNFAGQLHVVAVETRVHSATPFYQYNLMPVPRPAPACSGLNSRQTR